MARTEYVSEANHFPNQNVDLHLHSKYSHLFLFSPDFLPSAIH